MASAKPGAEQTQQHRCCMGLAYFSRSLQQAGKVPVCLGASQTKQGHVELGAVRENPTPQADFKFVCMGYSQYPVHGSSTSSNQSLPYCEGVEISVTQDLKEEVRPVAPDAHNYGGAVRPPVGTSLQHARVTAQEDSVAEAGPGSKPTTAAAQWGILYTKFYKAAQDNVKKMQDFLKGEHPIKLSSFKTSEDIQQKLLQTAQRNVTKMSTAVNTMVNSVYSNTVKPVIDKLGGGEQ